MLQLFFKGKLQAFCPNISYVFYTMLQSFIWMFYMLCTDVATIFFQNVPGPSVLCCNRLSGCCMLHLNVFNMFQLHQTNIAAFIRCLPRFPHCTPLPNKFYPQMAHSTTMSAPSCAACAPYLRLPPRACRLQLTKGISGPRHLGPDAIHTNFTSNYGSSPGRPW